MVILVDQAPLELEFSTSHVIQRRCGFHRVTKVFVTVVLSQSIVMGRVRLQEFAVKLDLVLEFRVLLDKLLFYVAKLNKFLVLLRLRMDANTNFIISFLQEGVVDRDLFDIREYFLEVLLIEFKFLDLLHIHTFQILFREHVNGHGAGADLFDVFDLLMIRLLRIKGIKRLLKLHYDFNPREHFELKVLVY